MSVASTFVRTVVIAALASSITVPVAAAAPKIQSAAGVTVRSVTDVGIVAPVTTGTMGATTAASVDAVADAAIAVPEVGSRTVEVRVSTPSVGDGATVRGNGMRIQLPSDYYTSTKRYPVVYLLHGAGASAYDFWDSIAHDMIERQAADKAIIVMPDGGKNGWYTNWLDGGRARQNWQDYHLNQLVPFIDANLRTIATREGRAIAGVSMGGFGAMKYAGLRPDLFSAVASFSGALNLQNPIMTTGVMAIGATMGQPFFGAYGSPMWPFNWHWVNSNPVANPGRYSAVKPFIFIGRGTDIAEQIVRSGTYEMKGALERSKVPFYFEDYGIPGRFEGGTCDGGHGVQCGPYALLRGLPKLLEVLTPATNGGVAKQPAVGGLAWANTALPPVAATPTKAPGKLASSGSAAKSR